MSLTYIKKEGPKQTPEGYHQWRSQALKAGWAQGAWGTEVLGRSPQKLDIYKQFDIDLATEFNHIKDWVAGSQLKLTLIRQRILCYARARYFHMLRGVYPQQPMCYFYCPSQLPLFPSLHIPPFPSLPPPFPLLLVLPFFPLLPLSCRKAAPLKPVGVSGSTGYF